MAGARPVVNWVKHKARPFIFTAALPAMQMAAALKALEIIEAEPWHRRQLWRNVTRFKDGLEQLGFDTLGTQTQIIPVLVGSDELTMIFWKALWEEGIFTTPALPPAVPPSKSIIRTSINANHTEEQIDQLLETFAAVGKNLGVIV
jgi:7-keto-8-aminopelargonate synthetase-like enzyme